MSAGSIDSGTWLPPGAWNFSHWPIAMTTPSARPVSEVYSQPPRPVVHPTSVGGSGLAATLAVGRLWMATRQHRASTAARRQRARGIRGRQAAPARTSARRTQHPDPATARCRRRGVVAAAGTVGFRRRSEGAIGILLEQGRALEGLLNTAQRRNRELVLSGAQRDVIATSTQPAAEHGAGRSGRLQRPRAGGLAGAVPRPLEQSHRAGARSLREHGQISPEADFQEVGRGIAGRRHRHGPAAQVGDCRRTPDRVVGRRQAPGPYPARRLTLCFADP